MQRDILYENELVYAIYDAYPVSKGHALIIPKRHVETYFDMNGDELSATHQALVTLKERIDALYGPDGYNIGVNAGEAAGQTIFHLHIHLIPRYKGDVQKPRGGVRGVIPSRRNY